MNGMKLRKHLRKMSTIMHQDFLYAIKQKNEKAASVSQAKKIVYDELLNDIMKGKFN